MEEWDYIEVEGEKMEGYCMYSYRSEKVHVFYRMNKGLTEILEVIREKNKDHIPKTKRPLWCFLSNFRRVAKSKCYTSHCPFFAYCDAEEDE